jgi:hypothetical protein
VLINTFASLHPKRWNEWVYLVRRYIRAWFRGAGAQAELTANRIFPRPDQEEIRRELVSHIRQTDPQVYNRLCGNWVYMMPENPEQNSNSLIVDHWQG